MKITFCTLLPFFEYVYKDTNQHCFMRRLNPSGQLDGMGRCRLLLPTPQIMAEESTSLYGVSWTISSHRTMPYDLNKLCRFDDL